MSDRPLLIFIHIPRTGGTSMWRAMGQVYGRRMKRIVGRGMEKTRAEMLEIVGSRPNAYDLLGGHVPVGIGDGGPRPCRYLTILRDPTRVVLSRHYKALRPDVRKRREARKGKAPARVPETGRDPIEVLKQWRRPNLLTRVLSGATGRKDTGRTVVTPEHLELAKRNLAERFACFGFIERFEESLELMAASLEWGTVPEASISNRGPNAPRAYGPEVYAVGREVNALDYELYEHAERLFQKQREIVLGCASAEERT